MVNLLKDILYLSGMQLMYRRSYYIGFIAYIFMLLLSVVYYKERTMLNDLAYNLFYILKDSSFAIQHFRFGEAFTQVFAVVPAKAGSSLSSVLHSYSAGFVLLNLTMYVICGSVLKQYRFALVLLLCNILFTTHTFYYPSSPLAQGIAFFILILAYISARQINKIKGSAGVFIFIATSFLSLFHPLFIFPLGFVLTFFWLREQDEVLNRKVIYATAICFFIALILKSLLLRASYDRSSMGGLRNFVTQFPDYFTLYSNKLFLYNCLTIYYWIPILAISISVVYAATKEWRKLGLFTVTFIGYLFLINISYPSAITPVYYREHLYLALSAFLAFPFVFDVMPVLENKKVAKAAIALIIITGIIRIQAAHTPYTAHLQWNRNFLKEYAAQKTIISIQKAKAESIPMIWGTPYEFWIMSTLEQNKTASIIIDKDPQERKWAEFQNRALVVNWNIFPYSQLDPKYFHLTDTVTGYTIIK